MLDENSADISIVVDGEQKSFSDNYKGDFVTCTSPNNKSYETRKVNLLSTELASASNDYHGEWVGLIRTTEKGSEILRKSLESLSTNENFDQMKVGDLLNHLVASDVEIGVTYIEGHWMDIDNYADFEESQEF